MTVEVKWSWQEIGLGVFWGRGHAPFLGFVLGPLHITIEHSQW